MYIEGQPPVARGRTPEKSDTGSMNLVFVRLENKYKQGDSFDPREVEADFQSIKESYNNSQRIIDQLQERSLDYKRKLAEIKKGTAISFLKRERFVNENGEENSSESEKNLADQIFLDLTEEINKGKPVKSDMLMMALRIIKSGYDYKKAVIRQLKEEIFGLEENFRKINEQMTNVSTPDVAEQSDALGQNSESNISQKDKLAILTAQWRKIDEGKNRLSIDKT